jgi:hypothetical protein
MTTAIDTALRRFDEHIKLDWYDQSAVLREKRDRVLDRMRANGLRFKEFNQGSYAIRTGINPPKQDYDIDVGIVLEGVTTTSCTPAMAKKAVYDAVQGHTTRTEWRRNCIRVQYVRAGEPTFHVDLAVYANDWRGVCQLASGKQHSAQALWIESDPSGLLAAINSRYTGDSALQFRRLVRLLKYWAGYQFPAEGNAKPVGIGLTVSVFGRLDSVYGSPTDLEALIQVVRAMYGGFQWDFGPDGVGGWRLVERMPAAPYDDPYRRMTNQQMVDFKDRLGTLWGQLHAALSSKDPASLEQVFGPEFRAVL